MADNPRPIHTIYYDHRKEVLRTNAALHLDFAVPRAIFHMQADRYGARVCEVVDTISGALWAVVVRHTDRKLSILYKRDILAEATKAFEAGERF